MKSELKWHGGKAAARDTGPIPVTSRLRISAFLSGFLSLLFPRRCPYCGDIASPAGCLICPECEKSLPYIRGKRCEKCGKELGAASVHLCRGCEKHRRSFEHALCLLRYDGVSADMMAGLKYKHKKEYADAFAWLLYRHLGREIREFPAAVFVPVPVHKKRKRMRGYNQAEEICRSLAAFLNGDREALLRMGIPRDQLSGFGDAEVSGNGKPAGTRYHVCTDLLIRKKNTRAQKNLSAAGRLLNLQAAFEAAPDWERKHGRLPGAVILVDDIYTTGATMEACTGTLRAAGVKRVYGLCVCAGADV
ncbi:MAG: ComF family protein [Eubacteriales bacterium]|nr:ComF family protein [Eubacteriales bacterium]